MKLIRIMLKKALKQMFKLEDKEIVTWEKLATATPLVWTCLNTTLEFECGDEMPKEGVYYKLYPTKVSNQLLFITRIYKGFGYHLHSHDCKETITVINGSCIVNDREIMRQNDSIVFHKNTLHKLYQIGDAEYMEILVEFNKY